MNTTGWGEDASGMTSLGLGSCTVCDGLDFDNYPVELEADPLRSKVVPLAELYASSASGCEICAILSKGILLLIPKGVPHEAALRITLRLEASVLVEVLWEINAMKRQARLEFYTRRSKSRTSSHEQGIPL